MRAGLQERVSGGGHQCGGSIEWMSIEASKLAGEVLNVLRGNPRAGKTGDAFAMATPLGEAPVRGQAIRDIDGYIDENYLK